MEKAGIGSKLYSFGKRKCPCHWFMSQTTRNSFSITVIIQKYSASYIPFSLTDGKKGVLDKLIQWNCTRCPNEGSFSEPPPKNPTTTQIGNYVIPSLYYLEHGKGNNTVHRTFLENLQSRALAI